MMDFAKGVVSFLAIIAMAMVFSLGMALFIAVAIPIALIRAPFVNRRH